VGLGRRRALAGELRPSRPDRRAPAIAPRCASPGQLQDATNPDRGVQADLDGELRLPRSLAGEPQPRCIGEPNPRAWGRKRRWHEREGKEKEGNVLCL
jgi:hypothetical protein